MTRRHEIFLAILDRARNIAADQVITIDGQQHTYGIDLRGGQVNGRNFDRVFELGTAELPETVKYGVAMRKLNCPVDNSENGRNRCALDLEFIVVARDGTSSLTVETIYRDLLAMLMTDRRLGGLCTTIDARHSGPPDPERHEVLYAVGVLTVTVYYTVPFWQI